MGGMQMKSKLLKDYDHFLVNHGEHISPYLKEELGNFINDVDEEAYELEEELEQSLTEIDELKNQVGDLELDIQNYEDRLS